MYRINEKKMFFDVADGLAVVINTTTGMYYGTGLLGTAILSALADGITPSKILAKIRENAGCPDDFEKRLDSFINELVSKEILIPAEDSNEEPVFEKGVYEEGFDLTLDEYAEVQDLLQADPIHDVSEEMGWPVLGDPN